MQIANLKKAINEERANLSSVDVIIDGKVFKFYYQNLTGFEHDRIRMMSKVKVVTLKDDGTQEEKHSIDEDMIRVNIILEKSCDENGKKLFSLTNKEHKDLVKNLSYDKQCYIAYQMGFKGLGQIIAEQEELLKKI